MERGVPGDPPLGPWKISTNCFYMLVKLCTYLPLKCNISGQMDLIFWHSLHLDPAHFFIFQGCVYFVEAVGPDSFRLWTRCGTWDCSSTTLFFFCVQFAIWLWFNTYDTNFWWFFGMNIHKSPLFWFFWHPHILKKMDFRSPLMEDVTKFLSRYIRSLRWLHHSPLWAVSALEMSSIHRPFILSYQLGFSHDWVEIPSPSC